jgi:hypothetical protein
MQSVPVLFNKKPSFSELAARAREEVHCHGDDDIIVEGVLHLGSSPNILRKMDVVVHWVLVDPISLGFSPPMGELAYFDPPIPERDVDVEVPPTIPDDQSALMCV